MKIKALLLVAALGYSLSLSAQDRYQLTIDLRNVVDDKVKVTCLVPRVTADQIEFRMPKMVPGTYSVYDFGRFFHEIKAFDIDGNKLPVERLTDNRVLIRNSSRLHKITYWIEDSFDTEKGNFIFEPAGTNIEEGKNYVVNTFGFVGYLEGLSSYDYEVEVQYPKGMFGASALNKKSINDSTDVFTAANYFDLADGPIMYAKPDTITFNVGGAEILISIYSPNKTLDPRFVKEQVEPTLQAQLQYLGELPVDKYAFIIYLFDRNPMSGKLGALEHSYSSFYSLPEINPIRLAQIIRDVAAHEFFHILTPLNIHSEEIGNFDFINPKMSKHLWMYEGVTEYAAGLAQVKYGEMSLNDYLAVLLGKINQSRTKFNDSLSFTTLSLNCLGSTKAQYGNVYQKGALIGMALDIRLRELSDGEYGIQNLMADLAKRYGKDTSFKDDELFDVITELTFPEIRDFFTQYVEGSQPIPYEDYLEKVGIRFTPKKKVRQVDLGHINFSVDGIDNRVVIKSIDYMNQFGKNMGYEKGDIIYKFDGVEIDIENYEEEFRAFSDRHQEGDVIEAVVLRVNKKNKLKKVKLSTKAIARVKTIDAAIEPIENPTESQLMLRKAWINK